MIGVPVFACVVALAFFIQWAAFVPAYVVQSERFFDITGSVTYILVTGVAVAISPEINARSLLLFCLVALWAVRLGSFLFR